MSEPIYVDEVRCGECGKLARFHGSTSWLAGAAGTCSLSRDEVLRAAAGGADRVVLDFTDGRAVLLDGDGWADPALAEQRRDERDRAVDAAWEVMAMVREGKPYEQVEARWGECMANPDDHQ